MKKLKLEESAAVVAGKRIHRIIKQDYKCANGSGRACRRAERMRERL